MNDVQYPQEAVKFQVQTYKRPKDIKTLREANVAFTGTPQKHPFNDEKVILVVDPYSANNFYYEFDKNDLSYVEELPSVVDLEGNTFTMVRIWVKKMSVRVRYSPFIVEDTRKN